MDIIAYMDNDIVLDYGCDNNFCNSIHHGTIVKNKVIEGVL